MKKIVAMCLSMALVFGFSLDASALWWKKTTVKCTVTKTLSLVVYEESETYEGTKDVCRSGEDWCLGSRCS